MSERQCRVIVCGPRSTHCWTMRTEQKQKRRPGHIVCNHHGGSSLCSLAAWWYEMSTAVISPLLSVGVGRWRSGERIMKLLLKVLGPPLAVLWLLFKGPQFTIPALLVIFGVYLATNQRYKWLYIIYKTLPRDLKWVSIARTLCV